LIKLYNEKKNKFLGIFTSAFTVDVHFTFRFTFLKKKPRNINTINVTSRENNTYS